MDSERRGETNSNLKGSYIHCLGKYAMLADGESSLGVNISSGEKPSAYNSNGLLHPDSNYKRKFEQVLVQAKQITDWALQSEAYS